MNSKLIKPILSLFYCLWLYSCSTVFTDVSDKYNSKDFVISAMGIGKDINEAKEKALANLSQSIYVSINSIMQTNEQLINDQFDSKASYDVTMKSNGYFQGVIFFNGSKDHDEYMVCAGINKEAYISTVNYLYSLIDEEKISTLSKTEAREELPQLLFLLSMLQYGKMNDILDANPSMEQKVIQAVTYLNYIISSEAEIRFVNNRNQTEKVSINLNGRIYQPNNRIFLNEGIYNYVISSPNFAEKSGSITLKRGDTPTISFYLQKLLPATLNVKAVINNDSNLNNDDLVYLLDEVVRNNQMKVNQTSDNKFIFRVGEIKSYPTFNSYNALQTNVELFLYKGETLDKQVSFTVTYLTQDQATTIPFNVFKLQFYNNVEIFLATLFD